VVAVQRKIDFEMEKHPLDVVTQQEERRILYQGERDEKHGVLYDDEYLAKIAAEIADPERRLVFWEILSEADHETALYLVLRYCMGYSATEVACGLGVSFARVKHRCNVARRNCQKRDMQIDEEYPTP
jgi:DNA-directed RNA polymerase specialized sigma24 family protein